MGDTVADASAAMKAKPTILVPPRGSSMEFLFTSGSGPGFSPGPMTLISSLFPEQGPYSFSQLLAGAMASPMAAKPSFTPSNNTGKEEKEGNPAAPQMESLSPLFVFPPAMSPSGLLNSPGFLSPLQSPFGMSHQQALAHVTAQAAFSQSFMQMQSEFQNPTSTANETFPTHQKNPPQPEPDTSKIESSEISQSDKKTTQVSIDKPESDGYNWRKYGQKHVKGNECPRSYYKCTHLNCPVKKKVERSLDGRVSEITYKGQHSHDPPQNNKRLKPVFASQDQNESEGMNVISDQSFEHLAVVRNNDDVEDAKIGVGEGDEDEPVAKRRSVDIVPPVPASSNSTIGDAKIVLQTRSEVDLLDDGYRWRKYGQKVVKGNPHPRSYYRCTYTGCNVRKHVERSSSDPKAVITTYEGKHNHDIPTGRYNNSHNTANANGQKTQKPVSKSRSSMNKEIDYGNNKEQIPITLQLKDEQIAV